MKKILQILLSSFVAIFLLFVSLYSLLPQNKTKDDSIDVWRKISKIYSNPDIPDREPVIKQDLENINDLPLQDNKALYADDKPDSVVVMYLTVRKGSSSSGTNHSWEEVNTATKFSADLGHQVDVPVADAILQVGDETGPLQGELGYGEELPNAVVSVRGNTSSNSPQKSFKIELRDKGPDFRGQKTIALNKHVFDPTRVINKLSFDLIKELPDMVSLRTQFVHLYIKDETTSPPNKAFQDYGLFTLVEQPNIQFLKNHLLDRYGQLYKATSFEFYRYPNEIRSADDPSYNEEAFSRILEIKGNRDHTKLIRMLDDINDENVPIKESFEKYFNEDNYFTWMAFNILVGNLDTDTQNFYLYSPENSEKWYFIPWDYDGAFSRQDEKTKIYTDPWREGVSEYWGNSLHRRVLMQPEYRQKLDEKIKQMLGYLTEDKINSLLDLYYPITYDYVTRMPDSLFLPGSIAKHDLMFKQIPDEVEMNYKLYQESLQKPMPFFLDTPQKVGDKLEFSWADSYDLNGGGITYRFVLATDPTFNNIIFDQQVTNVSWISIPLLDPGIYFWKVIASNKAGKEQLPFDYYWDNEGIKYFGVKYLSITQDGRILEYQNEE